MTDKYEPPKDLSNAHCSSFEEYQKLHKLSLDDPWAFWSPIIEHFHWHVPPTKENFMKYNFDIRKGPVEIEWMKDAKTNLCYNAVDRHIQEKGSQIAFSWEGNDPEDSGQISYSELHFEVCKFANVLKKKDVKKGDRVAIYMPNTIELVVAALACARIGAVHSIIFGGYSAESLASRIVDAKASVLVTADCGWRGTKRIKLLEISSDSADLCEKKGFKVEKFIVVKHGDRVKSHDSAEGDEAYRREVEELWKEGRDFWWHQLMAEAEPECDVEWMSGEDPLFMLYTSGSTGVPKGVLHTTAGYMIYAATTFKYVFDYQPGDIYWCTADVGWITGHSYVVYGPLINGASSVIFEGTPFHPTHNRIWEIVSKYRVSKFYTAPTAIRALMRFGEEFSTKFDMSCLKVLGSVGEPINPDAWRWYHKYVGHEKCAIVDTYWQTETGGHVITPLPAATTTKPGSASFPFFGVEPVILDEDGKELEGECEGFIAFKRAWPGMMRTVYGNHDRFEKTYFARFPGYYFAGDGAKRDSDGYIWITGRVDDMLNCSGHLMSTAQVEAALLKHPSVAESAVVSMPHKIKGECLFCFVTPKNGVVIDNALRKELKQIVREKIAPFADPDFIQEAKSLPKTRSGKIMRRILRKIAVGEDDFGDISTLADPSVVEMLKEGRRILIESK